MVKIQKHEQFLINCKFAAQITEATKLNIASIGQLNNNLTS